jgi:hypothetical protein
MVSPAATVWLISEIAGGALLAAAGAGWTGAWVGTKGAGCAGVKGTGVGCSAAGARVGSSVAATAPRGAGRGVSNSGSDVSTTVVGAGVRATAG